MASLYLDYFCKNPISEEGRILSRWGLGLQVSLEGEHKCTSRVSLPLALWSESQLTAPAGSPMGLRADVAEEVWLARPTCSASPLTWVGLGFLTAWPPEASGANTPVGNREATLPFMT